MNQEKIIARCNEIKCALMDCTLQFNEMKSAMDELNETAEMLARSLKALALASDTSISGDGSVSTSQQKIPRLDLTLDQIIEQDNIDGLMYDANGTMVIDCPGDCLPWPRRTKNELDQELDQIALSICHNYHRTKRFQ